MSDFLRKHGLTLSEVFWYAERSKNLEKKYFIIVQKKFIFVRRVKRRNTFFLDIEKSNSKRLFLNGSRCKSVTRGPGDSLQKIKADDNQAKF